MQVWGPRKKQGTSARLLPPGDFASSATVFLLPTYRQIHWVLSRISYQCQMHKCEKMDVKVIIKWTAPG